MMSINMYYFPMREIAAIETIDVLRYAAIITPKNILENGKIVKYVKNHLKQRYMFGMEQMNIILKS